MTIATINIPLSPLLTPSELLQLATLVERKGSTLDQEVCLAVSAHLQRETTKPGGKEAPAALPA